MKIPISMQKMTLKPWKIHLLYSEAEEVHGQWWVQNLWSWVKPGITTKTKHWLHSKWKKMQTDMKIRMRMRMMSQKARQAFRLKANSEAIHHQNLTVWSIRCGERTWWFQTSTTTCHWSKDQTHRTQVDNIVWWEITQFSERRLKRKKWIPAFNLLWVSRIWRNKKMNSIVKKKNKPMRMIKCPMKMIPLRKITDTQINRGQ